MRTGVNAACTPHVETCGLTRITEAMELRTLLNDHIREVYRAVIEGETAHRAVDTRRNARASRWAMTNKLNKSNDPIGIVRRVFFTFGPAHGLHMTWAHCSAHYTGTPAQRCAVE